MWFPTPIDEFEYDERRGNGARCTTHLPHRENGDLERRLTALLSPLTGLKGRLWFALQGLAPLATFLRPYGTAFYVPNRTATSRLAAEDCSQGRKPLESAALETQPR